MAQSYGPRTRPHEPIYDVPKKTGAPATGNTPT